jgi:hypothetical protein
MKRASNASHTIRYQGNILINIHICLGSDQTDSYIAQNIDRFSVHLLLKHFVLSFHQPSYCIQDLFVPYVVLQCAEI